MSSHQPTAPSESDSLLRAARKGEAVALRELFDRFHPAVLAYCSFAAKGDRDRARDLAQETFIRAFASLDQVREPDKIVGWLYSIAGNLCRSQLRQESRRRLILEQVAVEQELDVASDDPHERELRIAAVREVLERLPEGPTREIVLRKYGEPPQTTRDIARELGIPHGTVTVSLMRFRAAAKRELLRAVLEVSPEVP